MSVLQSISSHSVLWYDDDECVFAKVEQYLISHKKVELALSGFMRHYLMS